MRTWLAAGAAAAAAFVASDFALYELGVGNGTGLRVRTDLSFALAMTAMCSVVLWMRNKTPT